MRTPQGIQGQVAVKFCGMIAIHKEEFTQVDGVDIRRDSDEEGSYYNHELLADGQRYNIFGNETKRYSYDKKMKRLHDFIQNSHQPAQKISVTFNNESLVFKLIFFSLFLTPMLMIPLFLGLTTLTEDSWLIQIIVYVAVEWFDVQL